MDLRQVQTQALSLTQQQMLGLSLLQMNSLELEEYVQKAALENPVIDACGPLPEAETEAFLQRQQWLRDTAVPEDDYAPSSDDDAFDPLLHIPGGTSPGETLQEAAAFQLQRKDMSPALRKAAFFLLESLDDNGFLPESADELAASSGLPAADLAEALRIIRSLEPAGIGAADVRDCLCLQLQRISGAGLAERIVSEKLADLARQNYRKIAKDLSVPPAAVREAAELIRSLDPFPGRDFAAPAWTEYIYPEVIIRPEGRDGLSVAFARDARSYFTVNQYYLDLYRTTDDPEVRNYLAGKIAQARTLQWAVSQRESTLSRCVAFIAGHQADFFREGVKALHGARLSDAADALNLNVSTVSRAIRGKYLQCSYGVFPLSFFFSGSAKNDAAGDSTVSTVSLKEQLREMIGKDPGLSDRVLAEKLRGAGYSISRRTVAKYRSQLGLPNSYLQCGRPEERKKSL